MKDIEFSNIDDYKEFLKELFLQIAEDREYNIFMHCVTCNTNYFLQRAETFNEEIDKKVAGILKRGLNLDGAQDYGNYGSINGTAKFFGNSLTANVSNVANYDYSSYANQVNSIIIAIPKFISVYGEDVEFSSYMGSMKHASQHVKDCLFDLIKGQYLPTEFILAHQIVDKKTGCATIRLNDNHLSHLSAQKLDKLLNTLSKKCEDKLEYCKNRYNISSFEDVFKCMTDEHITEIDDYLNEI